MVPYGMLAGFPHLYLYASIIPLFLYSFSGPHGNCRLVAALGFAADPRPASGSLRRLERAFIGIAFSHFDRRVIPILLGVFRLGF